jgi:hypothetical protein
LSGAKLSREEEGRREGEKERSEVRRAREEVDNIQRYAWGVVGSLG